MNCLEWKFQKGTLEYNLNHLCLDTENHILKTDMVSMFQISKLLFIRNPLYLSEIFTTSPSYDVLNSLE